MKISFLQFCMFFILAQGFGTIFNLLGNAINDAVAASSGGDASAMNPVNEMLDSLSPVMILYVGFLGPIMEEYISTLMSLFSKNSISFYIIRHLLLSSLIFTAKKKMTTGLNRLFLERKKEIYLLKNAWNITLTEISSLKMGLMTNL